MTPVIKLAATWLTTVLTALAPVPMETSTEHEDPATRAARIESVAADIAEVVYDPTEMPIFVGPNARHQTAAIVATFAAEEGMNLSHKVDSGLRRGDSGRSWCIMQMNIGKGKTPEGWTGPELIADRKKCIRAGLHALRRSYWFCNKNHEHERFAVYASGNCDDGRSISRRRYDRALRRMYADPPPLELKALVEQSKTSD